MSFRKKILKRFALTCLLLFGCAALFVWQFVWFKLPHYSGYGQIDLPVPILSHVEYDKVFRTHARPYVVTTNPGKSLLLYGATHTKKHDDPQFADIEKRWTEFQPTVALIEGRLGLMVPGMMNPVDQFGEMGFANALARRSGVRSLTWELPLETEVARVLEHHPKEQVALFYVLRPYFSNLRHGKPADPDASVEGTRGRRTKIAGIQDTVNSIADIDRIWKRDFPAKLDWRETSDATALPGYLNDIFHAANQVRDEHFARVIIDLVRKGERVFAIAGSSHAVKLEPALKAALQSEPAKLTKISGPTI